MGSGQQTLAAYFQSGAAAAEATGQAPNGFLDHPDAEEDGADGPDGQPAKKKRGRSGKPRPNLLLPYSLVMHSACCKLVGAA